MSDRHGIDVDVDNTRSYEDEPIIRFIYRRTHDGLDADDGLATRATVRSILDYEEAIESYVALIESGYDRPRRPPINPENVHALQLIAHRWRTHPDYDHSWSINIARD